MTKLPRNITRQRQRGLGTIAMVVVLVVIGILFIIIFLFASAGGGKKADTQTQDASTNTDNGTYIRVPENSMTYKSSSYNFSFAYPNSFDKLTESTPSSSDSGMIFSAVSAPAVKKPVGNTGAILTGPFGAYVYKKDNFKVIVGDPDIYVAPTKTGNSTTWKIVSKGNTTQDIQIGNAYPVKSYKSQTGVTVFDFTLNKNSTRSGRYIFEDGDNYVLVNLPTVALPDGSPLTDADVSAYNVIGANLASTVTVTASSSSSSNSNGSSASGSSSSSSN